MKRIRLNQDYGYWGKTGKLYDVSDQRAKELLLTRARKKPNGYYETYRIAELVEDLGKHFGHSHHFYKVGGKSKAFPHDSSSGVTSHRETIENIVKKLNLGRKLYLCKLCGYKNDSTEYAMTEHGGRWWHNFCLKRTTWHTMKLIKSGQHQNVKKLKMFQDANPDGD